jgi:pyruvate ferredoxin oxidoreductase gamma subunit
MRDVQNFRWHARAGQGAVTASKAMGDIAASDGRYVQAFAEYGAEKRGAPVRAFNRISANPIRLYCMIEDPNWIICMDPSLIGPVDIAGGACLDSQFIINTPKDEEWLNKKIDFGTMGYHYVDATKIAVETIGRDIPNSPILGAIVKATGLFDYDKFAEILEVNYSAHFPKKLVDSNMTAFKRGYEEVITG